MKMPISEGALADATFHYCLQVGECRRNYFSVGACTPGAPGTDAALAKVLL